MEEFALYLRVNAELAPYWTVSVHLNIEIGRTWILGVPRAREHLCIVFREH